MADIEKPTGQQLLDAWQEEDDGFELVADETDTDDHGYAFTYVFKRLADGTFWETRGVNQGGGAYHSLRDDPEYAPVTQVYPITVTRTDYSAIPPVEGQPQLNG